MKLQTIIIDDEPDSISLLQIQLDRYCPEVEVIATYTSSVKASQDLPRLLPDLLFLDIEMPVISGFQLLSNMPGINCSVIFITAYNQHALKAFRFNAIDYLLKPIDINELMEAVTKAEKKTTPNPLQLSLLQRQMRGEIATKIAIPGQAGVSFIEMNNIIYVEAMNNYSKLFLTNKETFTISKTLKDVQGVLEESHFLRVHRQYIINLNRVTQFNRNESILILDNGAHLPIARNQKERLVEKYGWL